jgi:hypothetical protein
MSAASTMPDAQALYEALLTLAEDGATLSAVAEHSALLALTRVRDGVHTPTDQLLAARAREEITAACLALDDHRLAVDPVSDRDGAAVMVLLALATGYRSASAARRRSGAAALLGYPVVNTAFKVRPGVRSHAQNAVYAVADSLWERDLHARARVSAELAEMKRPPVSELAIDTLRRYEAYYSMYTPLSGLRADLTAAIEMRREGDTELNRSVDFDHASLYDYATFLRAKRAFEATYHGLWVFAQADIEQAMADCVKLIEHFSGLRSREESWLRLTHSEAEELHTFAGQLECDENGRSALRRWRNRIEECTCDLSRPAPRCRVHALMRACDYYTTVLDTDWYRVVPWHEGPPPNFGNIDPASLYRDVGLRDPPL